MGYIVKMHVNKNDLLGLNLMLGLGISSVVKVGVKVRIGLDFWDFVAWSASDHYAELPPEQES
jgi:hypothetical protein